MPDSSPKLTIVKSSSELGGNFMERNPALREFIASSGITAEEIERAIGKVRRAYRTLNDQLRDDHTWKHSKLAHAGDCADDVELYAPIFGFQNLECAVFKFMMFSHDIGRLEQGLRRDRGETSLDEDHGKLGVEHILTALEMTSYSMTPIWSLMLRAVECHSFRDTPTLEQLKDQPMALPLIQVMRDTDKIAGFKSAKSYVTDKARQARERRANWPQLIEADPVQGNEMGFIDPPFLLWRLFLNCKSLPRPQCRAYEGYMLQLLSWCNDVNIPEMLQIIIDTGGPKTVYDYLVERLTIGAAKLEIAAHRNEAQNQLEALQEYAQTWLGGALLLPSAAK